MTVVGQNAKYSERADNFRFARTRTFLDAVVTSLLCQEATSSRRARSGRSSTLDAFQWRQLNLQALLPRNASHDLLKRELRRVENVGYLLQTDRGRCGIDAQKLVCE